MVIYGYISREIAIGSIFGYVLVSLRIFATGIKRLSINVIKIKNELYNHTEIILEGIQTYLKIHCKMENAYEQMKNIFRGKTITLTDIYLVINALDIDIKHKNVLHI